MVARIITLFFLVGVIFIIVKFKNDEEPFYGLKIIGYYLLGAFRFSLNKIHIPLGFIMFLLFLRNPKKNLEGKRYAAALGLIVFASALMIPSITESYYERTRYVEAATTNINHFDFQSHWGKVKEILELDEISMESAKVEDLQIFYKENGQLKQLKYEVIWIEKGGLRHVWVEFYEYDKRFRVRRNKIEQWLQYNRLISAERLFKKLDEIKIKNLNPEDDCPYYRVMYRGWVNLGIKDVDIFIIEENKIVPFSEELPIEGYCLITFGLKETGDDIYSSAYEHYYLFDVQDNNKK